MDEYIKKDDIIKWIDDSVAQCGSRYSPDMLNMMDMFKTVVNNCLPFADVVPKKLYMKAVCDVVRLSGDRSGEWVSIMGHSICNVCGYKASPILTNYCPNCGAKMGVK